MVQKLRTCVEAREFAADPKDIENSWSAIDFRNWVQTGYLYPVATGYTQFSIFAFPILPQKCGWYKSCARVWRPGNSLPIGKRIKTHGDPFVSATGYKLGTRTGYKYPVVPSSYFLTSRYNHKNVNGAKDARCTGGPGIRFRFLKE